MEKIKPSHTFMLNRADYEKYLKLVQKYFKTHHYYIEIEVMDEVENGVLVGAYCEVGFNTGKPSYTIRFEVDNRLPSMPDSTMWYEIANMVNGFKALEYIGKNLNDNDLYITYRDVRKCAEMIKKENNK